MEAYRNYAHHRKDQSISLAEFNNKSRTAKIDFTDHGNLALDIQYALQLKYDFFGEVNFVERNESFEPEFNCEILNLSNTPFESAPISVVRASSEKLQNLFVGHATEQKLNRLRLERFCKAHNSSFKIYQ